MRANPQYPNGSRLPNIVLPTSLQNFCANDAASHCDDKSWQQQVVKPTVSTLEGVLQAFQCLRQCRHRVFEMFFPQFQWFLSCHFFSSWIIKFPHTRPRPLSAPKGLTLIVAEAARVCFCTLSFCFLLIAFY